jgi:hypothetical protein
MAAIGRPSGPESFVASSQGGLASSRSQADNLWQEIPSKAASSRSFRPRSIRLFRRRSPKVLTSRGKAFRCRLMLVSSVLRARIAR